MRAATYLPNRTERARVLDFLFGARFRSGWLLGSPKLTHSETAPGTLGRARGATKNGPLPPFGRL